MMARFGPSSSVPVLDAASFWPPASTGASVSGISATSLSLSLSLSLSVSLSVSASVVSAEGNPVCANCVISAPSVKQNPSR